MHLSEFIYFIIKDLLYEWCDLVTFIIYFQNDLHLHSSSMVWYLKHVLCTHKLS